MTEKTQASMPAQIALRKLRCANCAAQIALRGLRGDALTSRLSKIIQEKEQTK